MSNLASLGNLGATILYEVDATKMKHHINLSTSKFDRIIFNFPHAGFHGREDDNQVIGMHTDLVEGFFRNAKDMLQANGEIHVTHKTSTPFCTWDIPGLARRNDLAPGGHADFKIEDYPGYNNKRGDGNKSDESFPLGDCCTFKFSLYPSVKEISRVAISLQHQLNYSSHKVQLHEPERLMTRRSQKHPTSYPSHVTSREYFGYSNNGLETHGRAVTQLDESVGGTRTRKQGMAEASGGTSSDYLYSLQRMLVFLYGQHPLKSETRLFDNPRRLGEHSDPG